MRKISSFGFPIVIIIVCLVAVVVFIGRFTPDRTSLPLDGSGDERMASDYPPNDLSGMTDLITLKETNPSYEVTDVIALKGTVHALIADSPEKFEIGLSNRDSLPADAGMIFRFPNPGRYEFWMKDMRFPLDIVWIDTDKTVVGVTRGLSPETYPSVFLPPSPIGYVLEVNAGAAAYFGLATGTALRFK